MRKINIIISLFIFFISFNFCQAETIQEEIERIERKANKYEQELNNIEGSNWTLWVTDGVILSDLNVYSYTQDSIIFKNKNIFYQLTIDMGCALNFTWGNSLDKMDNYIGSDDFISKYH